MTTSEVLTLVGLLITGGGAMGAMWWRLSTKISTSAAKLHGRIDKTRDEYVRRDDLMHHIGRIEKGQQQIIDAVTQLNARIDSLADRRV